MIRGIGKPDLPERFPHLVAGPYGLTIGDRLTIDIIILRVVRTFVLKRADPPCSSSHREGYSMAYGMHWNGVGLVSWPDAIRKGVEALPSCMPSR